MRSEFKVHPLINAGQLMVFIYLDIILQDAQVNIVDQGEKLIENCYSGKEVIISLM